MSNSITLKDVNGNAVYPSIDVSEYTGEIAEGNTGFVSGGEIYEALTGKANKSDIKPQENANWNETDEEDPSYIKNKPTLYTAVNYDDEHYRRDAGKQPQYVYNCHEITTNDLYTNQFIIKLPLGKIGPASNITLMGDIYSIRGLPSLRGSGSAINVTSNNVTSIDIVLGDSDGKIISYEPVMRHIDSSEFAISDRHVSSNMSQCRFHFTHFGSCNSSASRLDTEAVYLLIKVTLSSNQTDFVAGNVFQVLATWVVF